MVEILSGLSTQGSGSAAAAWLELDRVEPDRRRLARARVVARDKANEAHVAFDMLRTRLLRSMGERKWRSVMVTSPSPGCGKTTVSLNLAFSLARRAGSRTILIELDFVRPQIQRVLGLARRRSIAEALSGEADPRESLLRYGDTLALGLATARRRDSAELLQSAACAECLREIIRRYDPDVLLFDLPPLFAVDDALGFAPRADCAVLVAAEGESTLEEIDDGVSQLAQVTNILGVVMNKSVFREGGYYGHYNYRA